MAYVDAATRRPQLVGAAVEVLARAGVAKTTLRAVAEEAGVPLATLQHVFPAKAGMLRAVIEEVADQIAQVLAASVILDQGVEHALRTGVHTFWDTLVVDQHGLQIMQYELTTYALRTGHADLAKLQYQRLTGVVAEWCERAADASGEALALPLDQVGRLVIAGIDGVILQQICDPDHERSHAALDALVTMVIGLARPEIRPTPTNRK